MARFRWLAPAAALALATGAARADGPRPAPDPCVNRETTAWRQVRDATLGTTSLDYCTGDDCWTMALATTVVTNVPKRAPMPASPPDPAGVLTDGKGTTRATANGTDVEFCPGGKGSCTSFHYELPAPAVAVYPELNDAGTLGAILYRGEGEENPPKFLVAFDLARGKQQRLAGHDITVLDHGFLVDHTTLYSARFKKLGKLATPDEVWVKLGSTDRIALRDERKGQVVIQDTTTGRVVSRIPTRFVDPKRFVTLVASPDGATLYAIGSVTDEGEVLTINTKTAKVTARATPAVCATGTHRVN